MKSEPKGSHPVVVLGPDSWVSMFSRGFDASAFVDMVSGGPEETVHVALSGGVPTSVVSQGGDAFPCVELRPPTNMVERTHLEILIDILSASAHREHPASE